MRLRKFLWWLSDVFWLKILGGNYLKKEYKNRSRKVIEIMVSFFEEGEPYVIEGKWSWFKSLGVHYPISILFTEQPVAVQIFGPEIGTWDGCRRYCKNIESWEVANQAASSLVSICDKIGLPIITIYWNEPIDTSSLEIKLKELSHLEIESE